MGTYDTFIPQKKIVCPKCGIVIDDVQTKELNCDCHCYSIGNKITSEGNTGMYNNVIIEQELYCECTDFLDTNVVFILIEDGCFKQIKTEKKDLELKYNIDKYENLSG